MSSELIRLTDLAKNQYGLTDFYLGNHGDLRLNDNVAEIYKAMSEKQIVNIRLLAGKDRATEVRMGRTMSNENINIDLISSELVKKTNLNCEQVHHVIVPQDTVENTYINQAIKKADFGYTTNTDTKGFFLHSGIVKDARDGRILGPGPSIVWHRDPIFDSNIIKDPERTTEEKESNKWTLFANELNKELTNPKLITIVGDRESDNYEYFKNVIENHMYFISRAKSDRILTSDMKLSEQLVRTIKSYIETIYLPVTRERKVARYAEFEIKYCQIKIPNPNDKEDILTLYCVQALEIGEIPKGEERVSWVLLTSHQVRTRKKALKILGWYSERWVVEDAHRIMKKQGMDIENSQIETPQSLMLLSILCYSVAVKIMAIVLSRDGNEQKASDHFTEDELKNLDILNERFSGRTEKQCNQHKSQTMGWAAWVIAKCGGWTCYGHKPGPIIMSRGYKEFQTLHKEYCYYVNTA